MKRPTLTHENSGDFITELFQRKRIFGESGRTRGEDMSEQTKNTWNTD
jgi:hypothetical protein